MVQVCCQNECNAKLSKAINIFIRFISLPSRLIRLRCKYQWYVDISRIKHRNRYISHPHHAYKQKLTFVSKLCLDWSPVQACCVVFLAVTFSCIKIAIFYKRMQKISSHENQTMTPIITILQCLCTTYASNVPYVSRSNLLNDSSVKLLSKSSIIAAQGN